MEGGQYGRVAVLGGPVRERAVQEPAVWYGAGR